MNSGGNANPHENQRVLTAGPPLAGADGVVILLHGRGGSAEDILHLGQALAPGNWTMLAPQAAGRTWYPYSFLAPRPQNEPYLSSALKRVESLVDEVIANGVPTDRVVLAAFSQGA